VYYSTNPQQPLSQWESQFVDNNKLTTISDLTPHTIYTIRVEAYTSIGPGPLSNPVQVPSKSVFFIIYHLYVHIFTTLKAR
jgi:receptor-type tyrosine-protein phosphatase F